MKRVTLIVAASLLGPAGPALASTACESPATPAQRLVCTSPALIALDQRLALALTRALAVDDNIGPAQVEWLAQVRERCTTQDCLAQAYASRIEALRRQAIRCPIEAAQLVGRWERVDGNGLDAVEFTDADGRRGFASRGDGEHEHAGSWQLRDCIVDLESDDGRTGLQVQSFERDSLRVEDLDEHETAVLKRRD